MKGFLSVWLSVLWLAVGCAALTEDWVVVRGDVTYRQRVAMPADAVVEVRLVDVTDPVAGPRVIAVRAIENPGGVPVRYELRYKPSQMKAGRPPAVQARILSGGKPWMVTGTVSQVMDFGRIARADVTLVPAPTGP